MVPLLCFRIPPLHIGRGINLSKNSIGHKLFVAALTSDPMQNYSTVCPSIHRPHYISFQSPSYIVYNVGCHVSRNMFQPWHGKSFLREPCLSANSPWCIPDSRYITAYTAAAVPFPVESQNICNSKAWPFSWVIVRLHANLSSPGHFPLNSSYCAFSSWGNIAAQGRCWSHTSLKTIFPTKVTELVTARGSYIEAKLLSISLGVAFC